MKIRILIVVLFLQGTSMMFAQIGSDSLFKQARDLAFSGKRTEARALCGKIIAQSPNYVDAQILAARTFMWDGKYDSARTELNNGLKTHPQYYDAIDASVDCEYYADKNAASLKMCETGLSFNPNDENFMIKKAKNLRAMKQADSAKSVLNQLLTKNPNSDPAKQLLQSIKIENLKNSLSISYSLDYFANNALDPWHLAYLQYGRKTSIGKFIVRANVGNRFKTNGTQAEVDYYLTYGKGFFGYWNTGYSPSSIFSKFRAGGDLYKSLPKGFEASVGFRYLVFTNSNVMIYTPYIGKYIGNYWISLRSYIIPGSTGTSASGNLLIRRYFSDRDNYISFQIGYGNSPDDTRRNLITGDALRLRSERVRIGFNKKVNDTWIFNVGTAYAHEEYLPLSFRDIFTFDFAITKLF